MRGTLDVKPSKPIAPQKVKLSLKKRGNLLAGSSKKDLPIASYYNFPQVVQERQEVQIIDVGNRIIH